MVEITDEMVTASMLAFSDADDAGATIEAQWRAALSAVLPDAIAQARRDAMEEAAKIAHKALGEGSPIEPCCVKFVTAIAAAIRTAGGEK